VLLQLALVQAEADAVPKEPGQAVHEDRIERWRTPEDIREQGLEHGPLVVGGRGAGLDVFHGD